MEGLGIIYLPNDYRKNMKKILFVCKGNSGRSQMAEAFFNCFCKTREGISAGTNPDERVHPQTVQLMKDIGMDVTKQKPKLLTDELMGKADKIIVMDSEVLETISQKYLSKVENWQIEKLLGKSQEQVKEIRDQIEERVKQLLQD